MTTLRITAPIIFVSLTSLAVLGLALYSAVSAPPRIALISAMVLMSALWHLRRHAGDVRAQAAWSLLTLRRRGHQTLRRESD